MNTQDETAVGAPGAVAGATNLTRRFERLARGGMSLAMRGPFCGAISPQDWAFREVNGIVEQNNGRLVHSKETIQASFPKEKQEEYVSLFEEHCGIPN
jgi:hypothetical protein